MNNNNCDYQFISDKKKKSAQSVVINLARNVCVKMEAAANQRRLLKFKKPTGSIFSCAFLLLVQIVLFSPPPVSAVCQWQNGKLTCEFHQSDFNHHVQQQQQQAQQVQTNFGGASGGGGVRHQGFTTLTRRKLELAADDGSDDADKALTSDSLPPSLTITSHVPKEELAGIEISHISTMANDGGDGSGGAGAAAGSGSPKRLDSEIEEIHQILPSLLDPTKIKKLINPRTKQTTRAYPLQPEGVEEQHEQHELLPKLNYPSTPSAHEFTRLGKYLSSYLPAGNSIQSTSAAWPMKPLLPPVKKKPYTIQILNGLDDYHQFQHNQQQQQVDSYPATKSTLLLPASKPWSPKINTYDYGSVNDNNNNDGGGSDDDGQQSLKSSLYEATQQFIQLPPFPEPKPTTTQAHYSPVQVEYSFTTGPIHMGQVDQQQQDASTSPHQTFMMPSILPAGAPSAAIHSQQGPVPHYSISNANSAGGVGSGPSAAAAQPFLMPNHAYNTRSGPAAAVAVADQQFSETFSMPLWSIAPAPLAPHYAHAHSSQPSMPRPHFTPHPNTNFHGPNSYAAYHHAQHPSPTLPSSSSSSSSHHHQYYANNNHNQQKPANQDRFTTEKESILNALKIISQTKPGVIKDVVKQANAKNAGAELDESIIEFVSNTNKKENIASAIKQLTSTNINSGSETGSSSTRIQAYRNQTKYLANKKNSLDNNAAAANDDYEPSIPIDQVLALLLSNQKYSSTGKNYFKNSFTQEKDGGLKNHPNELAKILYDMGILQRIARGSLTVDQMELVNKLIDLNHQEQELEELMKKKKVRPAKYIVPRATSSTKVHGANNNNRYGYDDEQYEQRRYHDDDDRSQSQHRGGYVDDEYDGGGGRRGRERRPGAGAPRYSSQYQRNSRRYDDHRNRYHHHHDNDDQHYPQYNQHHDREMLMGGPNYQPPPPQSYHNQDHQYPQQHQYQQQHQHQQPSSESPVQLNIIIPPPSGSGDSHSSAATSSATGTVAVPPQSAGHLDQNDTVASGTAFNFEFEVGGEPSQNHQPLNNDQQQQQYGVPDFNPFHGHTHNSLSSVISNHPLLQKLKNEWWRGVGAIVNDLTLHQQQQLQQQQGQQYQHHNNNQLENGEEMEMSSNGARVPNDTMMMSASHNYKRQELSSSPVMVQLLSTIGLLSSFMVMAFIGIQMQKGGGHQRRVELKLGPRPKIANLLSKLPPSPFLLPKDPKNKGPVFTQQQQQGASSSNSKEKIVQQQGHGPLNLNPHQQQHMQQQQQQHLGGDGHGVGVGGGGGGSQEMGFLREKLLNSHEDTKYSVHFHFKGQEVLSQEHSTESDETHEDSGSHEGSDDHAAGADSAERKKPKAVPTGNSPFDDTFMHYLDTANKFKLVNNPALLRKISGSSGGNEGTSFSERSSELLMNTGTGSSSTVASSAVPAAKPTVSVIEPSPSQIQVQSTNSPSSSSSRPTIAVGVGLGEVKIISANSTVSSNVPKIVASSSHVVSNNSTDSHSGNQ